MRSWYFSCPATVAIALTAVVFAVLTVAGRPSASAARPSSMLTIYPRLGSSQASGVIPHGPGLILMGGGGDVDAAFVWMHDVIAGSQGGDGGDIVVLRASGDYDYDPYLMKLARFNSVQTVKVEPKATVQELAKASAIVTRAQGIFFAGGDQANYVWWKGSSLAAAVQQVYDRGGVVGGNSAGLAIMGEWIYDSVAADAAGDDVEVTTKNAVPDPSEPIISFTHDLFVWPPMRGIITDTHFVQRDRLGRLAAFLARLEQHHGATNVMGLGIDTGTALLVDKHGVGRLVRNNPQGRALFLQGGTAQPIRAGAALSYSGIRVTLLDKDGQTYDFIKRCARALTYTIDVDGDKHPMYAPANPYVAPPSATMSTCQS